MKKSILFAFILSLTFITQSWAQQQSTLEQMNNDELRRLYNSEIRKRNSKLPLKCSPTAQQQIIDLTTAQPAPASLDNSSPKTNNENIELTLSNNMTEERFNAAIQHFGFRTSDFEGLYNPEFLNTEKLCFLNKFELTAIMMYSMDAYRKLNRAYRENDHNFLENSALYLVMLKAGLEKLAPYKGFVKRGTDTDLNHFADHIKGATVEYKPFTSTSVGRGFQGNVRSLILSKNCKYIAPLSVASMEEEVLCLPGTQFKVHFREDLKTVTRLILEEVEN